MKMTASEWVVEQPSGSENSKSKIMEESIASCAKEEVHLPPQEEYFRSDKHAGSSLRKMECFFQNKTLTDVVLVAGTRKIQAHRLVLSSVSDYFSAMFTSNVREANQQEIVLKDVDPASLEDLVQYCYTGHIELREDNVETLLATSCLLQLNEVVDACCGFLLKQLHPSNCVGIRLYAESHGCHDLQKSAQKFTADHFMDVIQNQEFLLLPADEIHKLLLWEDINVPSEEKMFEALLAWLKYDLEQRKCELPGLLSHVKLPLLSPQFIADNLDSHDFLQDDRTTQSLILEALKYHLLPERRFTLQNNRTKPRKSTVGFLYAVGGMDSNKGATSIEKYDLRTNTWSQIANMHHRRLQFGVAVLYGKLFVVGGRDGLKTLNTVEAYDPQTQVWTTQSPMSTHRHGLGVGVLGGPLYAVGGHDGWSYLNTVERLDPTVRQWCYVAPMTTQRSTVGVAVLNDKLFAVGGRDGSSCLRTVECYDPHTNKWTLCAPMNKRRGGVGVGVAGGYLFAFGGHDSPASNPCSSRFDCVERYDLTTDTWTVVTCMSIGRDAVGISLLGDRLFATGGYDGQQYLDLVEAYDPQTNEWEQMASLNVGRAGACAVVVRNNLV